MGWSIGYDSRWDRDIGYGVPAYCDHPGCRAEIDRGLSFVCGGEPYGGDAGCGLYFCGKHRSHAGPEGESICSRCERGEAPFAPAPEHPRWIRHKLTHKSWAEWRDEHPEWVRQHATKGRRSRERWP